MRWLRYEIMLGVIAHVLLLDLNQLADDKMHQQYQTRYQNRRSDQAGDDHLMRLQLDAVRLVVAALAYAEEGPEHGLRHLQRRRLFLSLCHGHPGTTFRFAPSTRKKV